MKKHYFIASLGALALVACSENGFVREPVEDPEPAAQVPMRINYHVGNMGRANGLETEVPAFGVYAIKANNQADIDLGTDGKGDNVVMWDYLVGYWNNDWGYRPADNENFYGGENWYFWYYQNLGSNDTHGWVNGGGFTEEVESRNEHQYLKFWDKSKTSTYFYAFTPYTAASNLSKDGSGQTKLSFGKIKGQEPWPGTGEADGARYMYAIAKENNATMIANKDNVDLTFRHLNSQIRLCFYEEVAGYKVDIEPLNSIINPIFGQPKYPYIYCVPTHEEGGVYTIGKYLNEATANVFFNETDSYVSYTDIDVTSYTQASLTYPHNWFSGEVKTRVPEGYANRSQMYGDIFNVIPANHSSIADQKNDGFTLNVSLKFTADDTNEVFYVYGARVYVPAEYTNWEPNKLYTYVFKITKNVTGDTGTPDVEPKPGPGTSALWPIIFDQMEVSDYVEEIDKSLGDIQF